MWLMRSDHPTKLYRGVEHTYHAGSIPVINGKLVCEDAISLQVLQVRGYRVVAEFQHKEDLVKTDPTHAIELAKMGLGPLKGASDAEIMELQRAYEEDPERVTPYIEDAMDEANQLAAPKRAFTPDASGLTAEDAVRLQGIYTPVPPANSAPSLDDLGLTTTLGRRPDGSKEVAFEPSEPFEPKPVVPAEPAPDPSKPDDSGPSSERPAFPGASKG
jgi:hypothetical protein